MRSVRSCAIALMLTTGMVMMPSLVAGAAEGTADVEEGTTASKEKPPESGGRLVFIADVDGHGIYTMRPNGRGLTKVRDLLVDFDGTNAPQWSPDGKWILFDEGDDCTESLIIMRPDGSDERQITVEDGARNRSPRWTPDGRIAWSRESGCVANDQDIFVMDLDGSNVVNLTSSPQVGEYDPVFTPDGSMVAYAAYSATGLDLYFMNADGSNQRNITGDALPGPSGEGAYEWSRDGKWLLWGNNSQIWSMSREGTEWKQLVQDDTAVGASLSPNNKRVAFVSYRTGEAEIYVGRLGGRGHRVTEGIRIVSGVDWRPAGG